MTPVSLEKSNEPPHIGSRSAEERFAIPAYSLLDNFAEWQASSEGVNLRDLCARDTIGLKTANSEYRIVLIDPLSRRALVQGGKHFLAPTEATLRGSSCGGAMLHLGWIGIGFQFEFVFHLANGQPQDVVTSPVEALYLERAGQ
jgi:hypothetical protein